MSNRFAATPVSSPGTPEQSWRRWGTSFPPLHLRGCRRLVVVAPHPDDEVLGVGGLMALARAAGASVEVVAVTDGAASHQNSSVFTPAELSRIRPTETARALAELGVDTVPIRLGCPDGAVSAHEGEIVAALTPMLRGDPTGTWCVGPWRRDGHPDHDTTGRACVRACRRSGARMVEYPIWMWHWATPGDAAVPWSRARSVLLPDSLVRAKRAAVTHFRTQLLPPPDDPCGTPVLGAHVLARLLRETETVFG